MDLWICMIEKFGQGLKNNNVAQNTNKPEKSERVEDEPDYNQENGRCLRNVQLSSNTLTNGPLLAKLGDFSQSSWRWQLECQQRRATGGLSQWTASKLLQRKAQL